MHVTVAFIYIVNHSGFHLFVEATLQIPTLQILLQLSDNTWQTTSVSCIHSQAYIPSLISHFTYVIKCNVFTALHGSSGYFTLYHRLWRQPAACFVSAIVSILWSQISEVKSLSICYQNGVRRQSVLCISCFRLCLLLMNLVVLLTWFDPLTCNACFHNTN